MMIIIQLLNHHKFRKGYNTLLNNVEIRLSNRYPYRKYENRNAYEFTYQPTLQV